MIRLIRQPLWREDLGGGGPVREKPRYTYTPSSSDSVELAYNADGMKVAAEYINSAYESLSGSIEDINSMFDTYIPGEAIKVEGYSDELNKAWHDRVDIGLQNFQSNYGEWSQVISLVNATGADFTADALATYGIDGPVTNKEGADANKMKEILESLGPLKTYGNEKKVTDATDPNLDFRKSGTVQQYNNTKKGMSDSELALLEEKNRNQANSLFGVYKSYKEGNANGQTSDVSKALIERQNPDVQKYLKEMYNEIK